MKNNNDSTLPALSVQTKHDYTPPSPSTDSESSTCVPSGCSGFAPLKPWLAHASNITLSLFAIVAAFATYFCVYAFRKAVFADTYEDALGPEGWFGSGMSFKTSISIMQTIGLTISKISGIKYNFFICFDNF
jgi:hypothetical protein